MNTDKLSEKNKGNAVLPLVTASYLVGAERVRDCEMEDFAKENNVTVDQLIFDMVNAGWTQGLDERWNYEYWEPVL